VEAVRKIIMALNVTPDGFCDHRVMIADAELHHYFSNMLHDAATLLFGRKTFQLMDPYWPEIARDRTGTASEIEFADYIEAIQKIVFSRKGIETSWHNTTVIKEMNPDEIQKIKSEPGGNIMVGSPSIIDQLSAWGLIDEYFYVMQPIIGGSGKRFFESSQLNNKVRLQLMDARKLDSGIISLHYKKQE
jgi:dihydrofolate reductase